MSERKSHEKPSYKFGGYSKPKRSPTAYRQWQPPAKESVKSDTTANQDNSPDNRSAKKSGTAAD